MNFLAHIYLSGDDERLKVGNFMADSIKGNNYKAYPDDLQKGILLHREIDTYTDSHPIVYKSAHRLFDEFRHYNGVIVDVFYDHFLAKNWSQYHTENLTDYVQNFYRLLEENFEVLPENVQRFYPYMKAQNWLLSYRDISSIETALYNMSRRTKGNYLLSDSIKTLRSNYVVYEKEFSEFFPQIIQHIKDFKKAQND